MMANQYLERRRNYNSRLCYKISLLDEIKATTVYAIGGNDIGCKLVVQSAQIYKNKGICAPVSNTGDNLFLIKGYIPVSTVRKDRELRNLLYVALRCNKSILNVLCSKFSEDKIKIHIYLLVNLESLNDFENDVLAKASKRGKFSIFNIDDYGKIVLVKVCKGLDKDIFDERSDLINIAGLDADFEVSSDASFCCFSIKNISNGYFTIK